MGFNHSVKVPTQYKKASVVFKKAIDEKKSVNSLIYEERHAKVGSLVALVHKFSKHRDVIESAIESSKILVDNPRLDPYLCRVLITELFFGTKRLNGQSKPVLCVLEHKEKLQNFIKSEEEGQTSRELVQDLKPRYVRINTNLIPVENVLKFLDDGEWRKVDGQFTSYDEFLQAVRNIQEDQYLIDLHVPNLLIFSPKVKSYWPSHGYVFGKKLLLQDKATSLVGICLNPEPNSVVLDMCAAPGMKTIHVSNIMNNTGIIYAVERDATRYQVLCDMVAKANATSVKPIQADALTVEEEQVPGVQYILVDPSCSGSGMTGRKSLLKEEKDPARLQKLGGLQIKLLNHAMRKFPEVKRIVYSTCSLYEEENEHVVQRCLEMCSDFKLLNGKKLLGRKWENVGSKAYKGIGKNCIYSLPDKDLTDGVFIAVFEKIRTE